MQFEESDWRSMGGMRSNLNLFRTLFGPIEKVKRDPFARSREFDSPT